MFVQCSEIVISISRNGLFKSCAKIIIVRSDIRKKQNDFKSVHFEVRMVLFYTIWKKSRFFPIDISIFWGKSDYLTDVFDFHFEWNRIKSAPRGVNTKKSFCDFGKLLALLFA